MREKVASNCFSVPCSNRRTSTCDVSFLRWSIVAWSMNLIKTKERSQTHPQNYITGSGSKQNKLFISSRSTRRDVGSGHGTDTLGASVRNRGHGAESERVISKGDTPHRLAQGAVKYRGGMKMHENSA